jgi:peptidoglycan hydrolase-like protein with peptidoglycan-binding domain
MPFVQGKLSDSETSGQIHQFSFTISTSESDSENQELIKKLLAQINFLQKEIARVKAQIDAALGNGETQISCSLLERNLSYGTTSSQVKCLQEFLKSQGAEIYPEGLVTGFFGNKTQAAVKRFQEKYFQEILFPLGLKTGSGYVGTATRAKINQILGYQS